MQRWHRRVARAMGHLTALLVPPRCLGCDEAALSSATEALCGPCRRSLVRLGAARCPFCLAAADRPLGKEALLRLGTLASPTGGRPRIRPVCGCDAQTPSLRGPPRDVAFVHGGPLARAIAAGKFGDHAAAWAGLAGLLLQHARTRSLLSAVDACVFVPSEKSRLLSRGYEHGGLLARALAVRTGRPLLGALAKTRPTRPQSQLGKREREGNLLHAFVADGVVRGQSIALIDDVTTTGATLCAAAAALHGAQARSVVAVCLAATPPRPGAAAATWQRLGPVGSSPPSFPV